MAHTPTPWTIDHDAICAKDQHMAVAIGPDGATYAEQKANAALIVRAVNAHADLVAALQDVAKYGANMMWHLKPDTEAGKLFDRIESALAKATA